MRSAMAVLFAIAMMRLLHLLTGAAAVAVLLSVDTSAASASSPPQSASRCGNISVPYPFGVGAGSHHHDFNLVCNETYDPPKLFIGDTGVEVLEISVQDGTVHIDSGILSVLVLNQSVDLTDVEWTVPLNGSLYTVSGFNKVAVLGCGFYILWMVPDGGAPDEGTCVPCSTSCADGPPAIATDGTCSEVGCCATSSLFGDYNSFTIRFNTDGEAHTKRWSLIVVDPEWWNEEGNIMAMQKAVSSHSSSLGASQVRHSVPGIEVRTVVNWVFSKSSCVQDKNTGDYGCLSDNSECRDSEITSGYNCMCQPGFQGNPYIRDGCQDINECTSPGKYSCFGQCINLAGSYNCACPDGTSGDPRRLNGCSSTTTTTKRKFPGLLVVIAICSGIAVAVIIFTAVFVRRKLRVWKARKSREFFFRQNRGLLLQRLVDKDIAERMIFTLEELQRATNNFDEARKLGGGGHGTVYKGILSDQRVVAIKKSKIVIKREIDDFINEVAILSQVNHRNVVKLFGCCLETEVPLLVYEFISNGTLSDHLHVATPLSLPWKERVRVGHEIARSLAYLHSEATTSIVHRDIKSSNILLDERLVAKVSDFGASRDIPIDHTGVNTAVQGTFGYLDPEYYHTWRLTKKSDVYSFGVILVELLTRKKPFDRMPSQGASLTAEFILLVDQDKLSEILDPQVTEEGEQQSKEVAAIAVMCLSLHGEDRPIMRQVETRLEALLIEVYGHENIVETDGFILNDQQNNANARDNISRRWSMEEEFLCSMSLPR
ncbi:unnamed protein product [Urochloa decumbens]|uniref:Protein kinase domain-containing protein n=1 Tax=Urochloa decumbens TaxID=240449 RepID=A0ABC9CM93_9POAL